MNDSCGSVILNEEALESVLVSVALDPPVTSLKEFTSKFRVSETSAIDVKLA